MVCDLCGGDPACVRTCSTGALVFTSVHAENMARRRGRALLEAVDQSAAVPGD